MLIESIFIGILIVCWYILIIVVCVFLPTTLWRGGKWYEKMFVIVVEMVLFAAIGLMTSTLIHFLL